MRIKMSYYEIIMKYHPEILVAKYHFVGRVGWHLCVQKLSKVDQKVQNVLYIYMVLLGLAMAMLVG